MCVTVPVAATLKSPFRRTAPTASPGLNDAFPDAVEIAPLLTDPLGMATNPMASKNFEKRLMVSVEKLESDSGIAIGFTPLIVLAGAATRLFIIFAKRSFVF